MGNHLVKWIVTAHWKGDIYGSEKARLTPLPRLSIIASIVIIILWL